MKRIVVALAIGAMVFATVAAAAAALNVEGGTVQAGGDTTLACDTDGVTLKWKTFLTNGQFYVAGVEVSGIDAACDGQKVLIALFETPTGIVGMMRGDISGSVANVNQFFSGGGWVDGLTGAGPPVSKVNNVQVLIKNAYVPYDGPGP